MPSMNWNDTVNLFSKLSLRRLWNGGKVLSSYLSKQMDKETHSMGTAGFNFI